MEKDQDPEAHHRPEYVILEPEEGQQFEKEEAEAMLKRLKTLGSKKFPWSIRFSALVILLFILLFTAVLLLYVALRFVLSALALFQSAKFNRALKTAWKAFTNTLAIIVGFFVAIFDPLFGFSIIFLHAMLHKSQQADFYTSYLFKRF